MPAAKLDQTDARRSDESPFPPSPPQRPYRGAPRRRRAPGESDSEIVDDDAEDEDEPVPPPPACWDFPLEVPDHSGNTPLYLAVSCRRTLMVKFLLDAGAFVNSRGPEAKPPLHASIQNGDLEIFDLLLEARADVNLTDHSEGRSALHEAIRGLCKDGASGSPAKVDSNRDADLEDSQDDWATAYPCYKMALRLVPMVVDVDSCTGGQNQTAMGAAASNGFLHLMEVLLQYGASSSTPALRGALPLSLAARCGQDKAGAQSPRQKIRRAVRHFTRWPGTGPGAAQTPTAQRAIGSPVAVGGTWAVSGPPSFSFRLRLT